MSPLIINLMKVSLLLIFLGLYVVLAKGSLSDRYSQFRKYAANYNKIYESKTVQFYRFAIYLKNMMHIQTLNDDPQDNAVYGETQFTDLTLSEARAMMGIRTDVIPTIKYIKNFTNDPDYKPKESTPDVWNWVQQGAVGPIKDQGSCGSCWTFSTVGNIESLNYFRTKQLTLFSEQQLIDCDKTNFGCGGGWPYVAITYLSVYGGLMTLRDYPLRTNYSGPCQFSEERPRLQIKGYMNLTHDENIIKDALYQIGPLSILLDFTGLMHYKSGVANPRLCATWPDHALVLVGYGVQDEDYWLVKNSWGVKWGINGYFMLKRGANKCGINLWATTAVLQD